MVVVVSGLFVEQIHLVVKNLHGHQNCSFLRLAPTQSLQLASLRTLLEDVLVVIVERVLVKRVEEEWQ